MQRPSQHLEQHARASHQVGWRPTASDVVRVGSRRWFLQTGIAGVAGLAMPTLLRARDQAAKAGAAARRTSVILFWLSGGPSHLDMWDPKPAAPAEVRGPFGTVATRVPGVHLCEHLPLQACIMDRLTLIR